DGGAIFGGLEHGAKHLRGHFARYFATRHGRNFRALAEAYDWPYQQVTTGDLRRLAKAGSAGLYEVPLV
ncbi:2-succinyl-5-enolpyruvyl-6-hydroxy-3-cyclohexene-1-carboxylic-acid synthase, partial [Brevibacterium paucivorans]